MTRHILISILVLIHFASIHAAPTIDTKPPTSASLPLRLQLSTSSRAENSKQKPSRGATSCPNQCRRSKRSARQECNSSFGCYVVGCKHGAFSRKRGWRCAPSSSSTTSPSTTVVEFNCPAVCRIKALAVLQCFALRRNCKPMACGTGGRRAACVPKDTATTEPPSTSETTSSTILPPTSPCPSECTSFLKAKLQCIRLSKKCKPKRCGFRKYKCTDRNVGTTVPPSSSSSSTSTSTSTTTGSTSSTMSSTTTEVSSTTESTSSTSSSTTSTSSTSSSTTSTTMPCVNFDCAKCGQALECYANTGDATKDAEICAIVEQRSPEEFCTDNGRTICQQRCGAITTCYPGQSYGLTCPADAGPVPGSAPQCMDGAGMGNMDPADLSNLATYQYCGRDMPLTCVGKCIDSGTLPTDPPTTTTDATSSTITTETSSTTTTEPPSTTTTEASTTSTTETSSTTTTEPSSTTTTEASTTSTTETPSSTTSTTTTTESSSTTTTEAPSTTTTEATTTGTMGCVKFDCAKCGQALECYVNSGDATTDGQICDIVRGNTPDDFCANGGQTICQQRCGAITTCYEGGSYGLTCPDDAGDVPGTAPRCMDGAGGDNMSEADLSNLASYEFCGPNMPLRCVGKCIE